MKSRYTYFWLGLLILQFTLSVQAQQRKATPKIPDDYCITADEVHLYQLINEYRVLSGLSVIPLSKSLSYVAHVHVRDLHQFRPDLNSCNLHSWSSNGTWTPCCYTKDPNRLQCMGNKPRELTSYMGNGQELILYENIPATPRSAFDQWKNFEATNNMFLNRDRWSENDWKAIGVAIYEGYAAVWFGEVEDKEKKLIQCEDNSALNSDWLLIETLARQESVKMEVALEKEVEVKVELEVEVKAEEVAQPIVPSTQYFLIVSSFKERKQAENEAKRLQAGGYLNATVVEKDGNFRVSVDYYDDLTKAQEKRRQLSNVFQGVWILENQPGKN